MKILILEDDGYRVKFFIERFGSNSLKITENAQAAIEYLETEKFDYLFLDNDLGEGNGEGTDVATFLFDTPNNPNNEAVIVIHSWNRPATEKMLSMLPGAVAAPFNTESFSDLALDI